MISIDCLAKALKGKLYLKEDKILSSLEFDSREVKKDSAFFGETLRYNKVLTPEFIDHEIKPGDKYYYRVSAIDENGLESKPSQEVTLSLPK